MAFTPSVESWIGILKHVAASDVTTIMPPRGDLATRADASDLADFLTHESAIVKQAVDNGIPVETAIATLDFSPYKTWHNFDRCEHDMRALQSMSRSFGIGTCSGFVVWRMFLSANRYPLRRNMRYERIRTGRRSYFECGPGRSRRVEVMVDHRRPTDARAAARRGPARKRSPGYSSR